MKAKFDRPTTIVRPSSLGSMRNFSDSLLERLEALGVDQCVMHPRIFTTLIWWDETFVVVLEKATKFVGEETLFSIEKTRKEKQITFKLIYHTDFLF